LIKPENKIEKVENILVIRRHNQIGDMLCSLTLYAALKKKYPAAEITLVAAKTNYEIPFFEINPFISRVLIADRSTSKRTLSFYKDLRTKKYQISIVPSTIKVSRTSHIINLLSGARFRVGVKSIDGIKNSSGYLLNVKTDFIWKDSHQLERNLDVAREIGCDLSEEEIGSLKFQFTPEEISEAQLFLDSNFPAKSRMIIGFHPGAGKEENRWKQENFTELILKTHKKFKNYVLLTSGWIDDAIVNKIKNELAQNKIACEVLHNLPVKKLGAIISLINLYITNDTGSMHLAGFSNAKMISLFGPTNPLEWAPTGINQLYIKSKTNNINDINVDEVFRKIELFLEQTNGDKI
jgi:ADP-heptose:LPS heptosyltransferase